MDTKSRLNLFKEILANQTDRIRYVHYPIRTRSRRSKVSGRDIRSLASQIAWMRNLGAIPVEPE